MRSGEFQNSRKKGCSESVWGFTDGAQRWSARVSAVLTISTRWPARKRSGLRMAHCSLTSSRSASPSGPKDSAMLARISSTVCRVRRVGACMKWTISPGERSSASNRPLSRAWATPSSVRRRRPCAKRSYRAVPSEPSRWTTERLPLTLLGFDQGERAGRGALYPREPVEGSEEADPRRQISQVHEPLDQRNVRTQDRAMHHEFVRRPAGPSGRGLLEEVAAVRFRPPLDEPLGGLLRQAGRLPEVLSSPDVLLRPVGPEEQDVAGLDRLARGLQLFVCLLKVGYVYDLHRLRGREVEDYRLADHSIQRDLIYGLPVLDRVEGGLHVGAGVQAHQVELRGLPVAGAVLGADLELHPEVRGGWSLEAVGDRRAEVYDLRHEDALSYESSVT